VSKKMAVQDTAKKQIFYGVPKEEGRFTLTIHNLAIGNWNGNKLCDFLCTNETIQHLF